MNKDQYIVKDVAKQKILKVRCKFEQMYVLDLRCYLRSLGYASVDNSFTREDLYKILKKEPKATHLFVRFPNGMFTRKMGLDAKREYQRRINLF
jgi:hypothetical protein